MGEGDVSVLYKNGKIWLMVAKLICGTVLMALAVNLVYEPLGMVTGGVSGLSIIVQRVSGIWLAEPVPVWLSNLLINIPIFIGAMRLRGKEFISMTFLANISFTVALFLIPVPSLPQQDHLLAAVVGGVLTGAGLGLVFSQGYSTGGTDLLGAILHHFIPYYPAASFLFLLDSAIIFLGICVSGIHIAFYAVIAVYLTSRVMDAIVEGGKFAKLAYIISDSYEEIGRELLEQLGRGVTVLEGTGMYTGKRKKTLLCVVDKKQISRVSQIAHRHDKRAFVIISDVREVQGEGFVEKIQS